jgi:hypothetical protein
VVQLAQIISKGVVCIEPRRMSLEIKKKKLDVELDMIRLQNKKNATEKKLDDMNARLQSLAEPKESREARERREMKELMETLDD